MDLQWFQKGNNAQVWLDCSKGIVFKQYEKEVVFHKEIGFLQRLAGLAWVPRVLATTTKLDGIWGIFMMYEGTPLPLTVPFEDVEGFIRNCVGELHVRGIHHHDIARQNILQRPDKSMVLIDFECAVDAEDCLECPCPDIKIEFE